MSLTFERDKSQDDDECRWSGEAMIVCAVMFAGKHSDSHCLWKPATVPLAGDTWCHSLPLFTRRAFGHRRRTWLARGCGPRMSTRS